MKRKSLRALALLLLLSLVFALTSCFAPPTEEPTPPAGVPEPTPPPITDLSSVPEFSGQAYVSINGGVPYFTEGDITATSYESYSQLDSLGRCGTAMASVGRDLMPTEPREGSLSSVTPSGWMNKSYSIIDGGYLYNRAHLIGWQLTAETTNRQNLITGTRFMNVSGMLPFENLVADYIKETNNHVMYRVTPIYKGNNLVASGVLMEALSVEDGGAEISFCVYVYNNQPGIMIDYATGDSKLDDGVPFPEPGTGLPGGDGVEFAYVLNTSTKKVHKPTCHHAAGIADSIKEYTNLTLAELTAAGYSTCGTCKPQ